MVLHWKRCGRVSRRQLTTILLTNPCEAVTEKHDDLLTDERTRGSLSLFCPPSPLAYCALTPLIPVFKFRFIHHNFKHVNPSASGTVTMESKFSPVINVYQDMYDFEDGHWWYRSLRKMLLHWVKQTHPKRILDAGTGTGANMYMLLRNGYPTVGVDISDHAIQFCQRRGLHQISKASVTHLPYESQTFDLVISMDVLPFVNVSDLPIVLAEFHRCLQPNGYVVVNLAALAWLQSEHDVAWDTKKRYRKDEIERLFKDAGFQIIKSTYRIFLLFPLVAGMKWLTNLQRLSDHTTETRGDTNKTNPLLNRIFSYVMDVEFFLNRFIDFPIGSSVFLVVQKRP